MNWSPGQQWGYTCWHTTRAGWYSPHCLHTPECNLEQCHLAQRRPRNKGHQQRMQGDTGMQGMSSLQASPRHCRPCTDPQPRAPMLSPMPAGTPAEACHIPACLGQGKRVEPVPWLQIPRTYVHSKIKEKWKIWVLLSFCPSKLKFKFSLIQVLFSWFVGQK